MFGIWRIPLTLIPVVGLLLVPLPGLAVELPARAHYGMAAGAVWVEYTDVYVNQVRTVEFQLGQYDVTLRLPRSWAPSTSCLARLWRLR